MLIQSVKHTYRSVGGEDLKTLPWKAVLRNQNVLPDGKKYHGEHYGVSCLDKHLCDTHSGSSAVLGSGNAKRANIIPASKEFTV